MFWRLRCFLLGQSCLQTVRSCRRQKAVEVREVGSPVGEFKETPERKEKQTNRKNAGDRQEKEKAPAKEEKAGRNGRNSFIRFWSG